MQRRQTTSPIAGDLGKAARRARCLVADGQSKDDNPLGADRHATGTVDALDCGEGKGIAGTTTAMMTTMTTTRKQALAAARTAIARCPSPKRRRIVRPSHESRRESSENSAEGEDCRRRRYDEGRTRRRRCQSAGCEGCRLLMTAAMGSGESGRGRTTKANNESGRPRRQR